MQVKAKLKYLRISPKKVRKVVDVVRVMEVSDALDYLHFAPQKAARFVLKTLQSAIANAEHNFSLKKDNLFISEIKADQGPTLKRWRARAFGRAAMIRKRSSHLSVVLGEKGSTKSAVSRKEKISVKADQPQTVKEPLIQPVMKEKKEPDKVEQKTDMPPQKKPIAKKILDIRRKGKRRTKQHLDKTRMKKKGGGIKKVFRRKSI